MSDGNGQNPAGYGHDKKGAAGGAVRVSAGTPTADLLDPAAEVGAASVALGACEAAERPGDRLEPVHARAALPGALGRQVAGDAGGLLGNHLGVGVGIGFIHAVVAHREQLALDQAAAQFLDAVSDVPLSHEAQEFVGQLRRMAER